MLVHHPPQYSCTMPADAKGLCWPPLRLLHDRLESIKLEPGAVKAKDLAATMEEYQPWLAKGVLGFKRPNAASKQALQTSTELEVGGGKRVPIDASLRAAAAEAAAALVSHPCCCLPSPNSAEDMAHPSCLPAALDAASACHAGPGRGAGGRPRAPLAGGLCRAAASSGGAP